MKTTQLYISALAALFVSSSAFAVIGPIKITLNPTELSSNYFNEVDTWAPCSTEVYTMGDIKASKSNNIYTYSLSIKDIKLLNKFKLIFDI